MRFSDWSSDVCSSDLHRDHRAEDQQGAADNERLDMPLAGALQDEDQEEDDRQDADESDGQPEADHGAQRVLGGVGACHRDAGLDDETATHKRRKRKECVSTGKSSGHPYHKKKN